MDVYVATVTAFWVMLPAYVPNNAAVLAGGGPPIDDGRTLGGRRLLGDGKTWRGSLSGWLAGVTLALVLRGARPEASALLDAPLPTFPLAVVALFPLGAVLGDIGASFLKRRTGRERGAPYPVVDQLDFVVGAVLAALVAAPTWTLETLTPPVLAVVLIVTPVLHVLTNALAYVVGLKDEPY